MVRAFVDGAMGRFFMVDPLSYFGFQPVLHNWCNKGCGMCYPFYWVVHIKEPLLLIRNSSPGGGGISFPLLLSKWSFTMICMLPYNHNKNVLSASLNKIFHSFLQQSLNTQITITKTCYRDPLIFTHPLFYSSDSSQTTITKTSCRDSPTVLFLGFFPNYNQQNVLPRSTHFHSPTVLFLGFFSTSSLPMAYHIHANQWANRANIDIKSMRTSTLY